MSSSYSSKLTGNSQRYDRSGGGVWPFYYFEAIEVNVSIPGNFAFTSNSSIDTYGYFYNGTFDPYYPLSNLLQSNDDDAGNLQFRINIYLANTGSYVLVFTTFLTNEQGAFSIFVSGADSVIFTKLDIIVNSTTDNSTRNTTTTSKKRNRVTLVDRN